MMAFYMTDFLGSNGGTSASMRGSDPGKPRVEAMAAAGLPALIAA
jgi:hypothetical protein